MGLRGILWDFENSRQLILACLYMGETEDYRTDDVSDKTSPYYTDFVELARTQTARMVLTTLSEYPGDIRSFALVRQELLNPDARQLWLAHWSGGRKINPMSVYAIPQVGFRQDIPTPSARYSRETVVEAWPGWKDTEDTVALAGAKVPVVRYPYEGEPDAPNVFSNGRGGLEAGWAKSEHDFLCKAGPPVMLRVFAAGQPANVQVELSTKTGKKLPTRIYLGGDKRVNINPKWITVLALPEVQLEPGSEYNVNVTFQVGETPIQRSWSFKTRSK
jgi:hypothetical protein